MITASQLRAARGLLDWSRSDLSKASKVSQETIKNIEHGIFRPQETTEDAIIRAFAAQDVDFTDNEGVRKHKDPVKTFSGQNGYREMLDHIYNTVRNKTPITRHLALADTYALNIVPDYVATFSNRMASIPHLDSKCLVWEDDQNFPFSYCEYRWLKKATVWAKPFYVYSDSVIFIANMHVETFLAVSITSDLLVNDMIEQFDALWKMARAPIKKN
ncbi:MAG: helix-turn-helix transcriptional regulator [Bdellovibrionales bacterium]